MTCRHLVSSTNKYGKTEDRASGRSLGMRLICSKIYLLFLPELLKIFPYYSLKYHLAIIPKLFRSDSKKIIAIAN